MTGWSPRGQYSWGEARPSKRYQRQDARKPEPADRQHVRRRLAAAPRPCVLAQKLVLLSLTRGVLMRPIRKSPES